MDRELAALAHLTRNSCLAQKLGGGRLDQDGAVIDWLGVMADSEGWSSGERVLIELAYTLWSGRTFAGGLNVRRDIVETLDDDNFRVAMESVMILRGIDILQLPAGVS